jgi:uncharacterized membrane protein
MDKSLKITTLATAIPLALISIISLIICLLRKDLPPSEGLDALDISLQVYLGFVGVSFLTSTVLYFRKNIQIAKRIAKVSIVGVVVWIIIFVVASVLSET